MLLYSTIQYRCTCTQARRVAVLLLSPPLVKPVKKEQPPRNRPSVHCALRKEEWKSEVLGLRIRMSTLNSLQGASVAEKEVGFVVLAPAASAKIPIHGGSDNFDRYQIRAGGANIMISTFLVLTYSTVLTCLLLLAQLSSGDLLHTLHGIGR